MTDADRALEYRRRAAELLQMAERAQTSARREMLILAAEWERLASRLEKKR